MKVAMVTGSFPPTPCGIGDYTARLCEELAHVGVEVHVFTHHSARLLHNETRNTKRDPYLHLHTTIRDWTFRAVHSLVRELCADDWSFVHLQYPGRGYGYKVAPVLFGGWFKQSGPSLPLALTLHEFRIAHPLRKLAAVRLLEPSDLILVPDAAERNAVTRRFPPAARKTRIVPNGVVLPVVPVSSEERDRLRAELGFAPGEAVVCHFGFIQRNKGVDTLLRSFAEVKRSSPSIRLLMACGLDPRNGYHHRLSKLAERLGIAQEIVWTGHCPPEQLSRNLSCADLCVLPFTDGVTARRTTFLAAIAHGLPVVTSAGEGTGEDLRQSDGLWLLPQGAEPREFAAACLSLVQDDERRRVLGARARILAEQFSWERVVKETLEAYRQVTGS